MHGLARGQRANGDLIPWTLAQQFQDDDFPSLSGARIVRIATHPEYQRMGYGSRAIELLQRYNLSYFDYLSPLTSMGSCILRYYEMKIPCLEESDQSFNAGVVEIPDEEVDFIFATIINNPLPKKQTVLFRISFITDW
jgi:hypothetical protein